MTVMKCELSEKLVLAYSMLVLGFASYSQQLDPKYEAIIVYSLTKYCEWPANNSGDFVINVLGEGDIIGELKKMAALKKVGSRSIRIESYSDVSELEDCHILFITHDMSDNINDVLTKAYGTLIITEKPGMGELGAGVNLVNRGGKLKIELNKTACTSNGIKISKKLEGLAILL
jgi:hypothetical protein